MKLILIGQILYEGEVYRVLCDQYWLRRMLCDKLWSVLWMYIAVNKTLIWKVAGKLACIIQR